MAQTTLNPYNNKNLFSNYYLDGKVKIANTFIDYDIKPNYLQKLPIRRISFTTPPDRRAALVDEAKALYSAQAPDSRDPAFKCGDFVGSRLSAVPEESDVVHDLRFLQSA